MIQWQIHAQEGRLDTIDMKTKVVTCAQFNIMQLLTLTLSLLDLQCAIEVRLVCRVR